MGWNGGGGGGGSKVTYTQVVSTTDMSPIPNVFTLVPGFTIAVTAAALGDVFVIDASVDFSSVVAGNVAVAVLYVDGVSIPGGAPGLVVRDSGGSIAQTWKITGLAAGAHTFTIEAIAITGTPHTASANSTMGCLQIS